MERDYYAIWFIELDLKYNKMNLRETKGELLLQ